MRVLVGSSQPAGRVREDNLIGLPSFDPPEKVGLENLLMVSDEL